MSDKDPIQFWSGSNETAVGVSEIARAVRHGQRQSCCRWLITAAVLTLIPVCLADESPFFVTYTTQLEEQGDLEITNRSITGNPGEGNRFLAGVLEFEYGATPWWTMEFYLDGQATWSQASFWTGYRWENRFRLLRRRHWINPVLYAEFENLNGADKALLTVVGHDGVKDLLEPVDITRQERDRELEGKLILDSTFKGWTIAENLIAEKNLSRGPYEFGYAVGIFRALNLPHVGSERLSAGVETYGGLGTSIDLGMQRTSHYVGPALAWTMGHGITFRASPNFGVTDSSATFLMRFGVSFEIEDVGSAIRNAFH